MTPELPPSYDPQTPNILQIPCIMPYFLPFDFPIFFPFLYFGNTIEVFRLLRLFSILPFPVDRLVVFAESWSISISNEETISSFQG